MRIVVIGPTYPFRGGIAHYTACLCKSLKKNRHNVKLFSFLRLYPKIIFPGTSQKDLKSEKKISYPSENTIDSMNPFSWTATVNKIKSYSPDLVIFQWWTSLFFPLYVSMSFLLRKAGIKVLFMCHNVEPHEKILSNKHILRMSYKYADYFITHSAEDSKKLTSLVKNKKILVSPHPTYDNFRYASITTEKARANLGIKSKNVLLFFGYIKKYKGLIYLIRAIKQIPKSIDLKLLVVGEFYENKQEYLSEIKKLGLENKILIIDKYVPNEDVGLYFSSSDVVLCPYITATQSGIIQIAYGFYKPVIATKVGGLPDVIVDKSTGLLVKKESPKALADAIIWFVKNKNKIDFKSNILKIQDRFSWDKMVETIEKFNK